MGCSSCRTTCAHHAPSSPVPNSSADDFCMPWRWTPARASSSARPMPVPLATPSVPPKRRRQSFVSFPACRMGCVRGSSGSSPPAGSRWPVWNSSPTSRGGRWLTTSTPNTNYNAEAEARDGRTGTRSLGPGRDRRVPGSGAQPAVCAGSLIISARNSSPGRLLQEDKSARSGRDGAQRGGGALHRAAPVAQHRSGERCAAAGTRGCRPGR